MHRLTAILLAASVLSLIVAGLVLPATMAMGAHGKAERLNQGSIALTMAAAQDGARQRSFPSGTNQVYAVVAYDQAINDQYVVRLTDLVGIRVAEQRVGPLSGTGKASVAMGVANFVGTYKARYATERGQLVPDADQVVQYCNNRPPVPDPWPIPEPTPGPGPTPRPNPYMIWAETVLSTVEEMRSTTAEMTRTLHAMTTLPNIADDMPTVHSALDTARHDLADANGRLAGMSATLLPNTGQPDPAAACSSIAVASGEISTSIATADGAIAQIPADVSTWRLPLTVARYEGRQFAGCSQYKTDLIAGTDPNDTPAVSSLWTVGNPGAPALIFPAPDQTDRGMVGGLGLHLPSGTRYLYAQSVTVPGTAHEAALSAFVTDANCLPVGDNVVLWASPEGSGGASIVPENVAPDNGEAGATLRAGNDVTHIRNGGWAIACVGTGCAPRLPTPVPGRQPQGQAWASARFDVVGAAAITNTLLKISPKEINRVTDETAGVVLQVNDRNGHQVANGTRARIWVDTGSPGMLAYDRLERFGMSSYPAVIRFSWRTKGWRNS